MSNRTALILLAALVADVLFAPGISDVTWAAIDMLLA